VSSLVAEALRLEISSLETPNEGAYRLWKEFPAIPKAGDFLPRGGQVKGFRLEELFQFLKFLRRDYLISICTQEIHSCVRLGTLGLVRIRCSRNGESMPKRDSWK